LRRTRWVSVSYGLIFVALGYAVTIGLYQLELYHLIWPFSDRSRTVSQRQTCFSSKFFHSFQYAAIAFSEFIHSERLTDLATRMLYGTIGVGLIL